MQNKDGVAHTVTADDGSFDVKVGAGSTATFTAPATAGTYQFHCKIHSSMHGTLTVTGSGGAAGGAGSIGLDHHHRPNQRLRLRLRLLGPVAAAAVRRGRDEFQARALRLI